MTRSSSRNSSSASSETTQEHIADGDFQENYVVRSQHNYVKDEEFNKASSYSSEASTLTPSSSSSLSSSDENEQEKDVPNTREAKTKGAKPQSSSSELSDVIEDDGGGDSDVIKVEKENSSTTSESIGLMQNNLNDKNTMLDGSKESESSDHEISEEIIIQSDHATKSSSTTDEELLRQFRQQQMTRRYRPRSAKVRHRTDPETQNIVTVLSQTDSDSGREEVKSPSETKRRSRPRSKLEVKSHSLSSNQSSRSATTTEYSSSDNAIISTDEKIPHPTSGNTGHSRSRSSSSSSSSSDSKRSIKSPSSTSTIQNKEEKKEIGSENKFQRITHKEDIIKKSSSSQSSSAEESERSKLRRPKQINTLKPHHRDKKQAQIEELVNKIHEINKKKKEDLQEDAYSYSSAASSDISDYQRRKFASDATQTNEKDFEELESSSSESFGALTLREILEIQGSEIKNKYLHYYLQNYLSNEVQRHGLFFKKYERDPPQTPTRSPHLSAPRRTRQLSNNPFSWIYLSGRLVKVFDVMGNGVNKDAYQRNRFNPRPMTVQPMQRKSHSPRLALGSATKQTTFNRSRSDRSGDSKKSRSSSDSRRKRGRSDFKSNKKKNMKQLRSNSSSRQSSRRSSRSSTPNLKKNKPKKKNVKKKIPSSRSRSRSGSRSSSRSSSRARGRKSPNRPKTALDKLKQFATRSRSVTPIDKRNRSTSRNKDKKSKSRSRSVSFSSRSGLRSGSSSVSSHKKQKTKKKNRPKTTIEKIKHLARSRSRSKSRSRSRSSEKQKRSSRSRSKSKDKVDKVIKPKSRSYSSKSNDRTSSTDSRGKHQKKKNSRRHQHPMESNTSSSDDEVSSDENEEGMKKKEKWYRKLTSFARWEEKRNEKRRRKNLRLLQEQELRNQPKPKGIMTRPRREYPDQRPVFGVENINGGYLLPQNYLSTIMDRKGRRSKADTMPTRIILVPAPVMGTSKYDRHYNPTQTRNIARSRSGRRRQKTKSIIRTKKQADSSASSSHEDGSKSTTNGPQIRPGSERIKCSWNNDTPKDAVKCTDHHLKNTDNPVILEWLKHKNERIRSQKRDETVKRRVRTEYLIDEQNFKDEKREKALEEYQKWKKQKDKEILIRRRNETLEANSTLHKKTDSDQMPFSALRSSSNNNEKSSAKKQRPKSASNLKVSFNNNKGKKRVRSASPRAGIMKKGEKNKSSSFMKSALNMAEKENVDERNNYDRWVRSSSRDNTPKLRHKKTQGVTHNPLDNELLSDLAKRRIKSILDSKKRVDTGMSRPRTAPAKIKSHQNQNSEGKSTPYKWRLRDDDVFQQKNVHKKKNRGKEKEERIKHSFNKKTSSKPGHFERNPIVRRSINESAMPA